MRLLVLGALLTAVLSEVSSNVPVIKIQPENPKIDFPSGGKGFISCLVEAERSQEDLLGEIEWLDIYNNTIDKNHPRVRSKEFSIDNLPSKRGKCKALIIESLKETDAGVYTCRVSYANSQILYAKATIQTYLPVTFTDAPENQYPLKGSNYKVKCKVSAKPAPTIEWKINDLPIPKSGRYVIETDGLVIKNVSEADDGVYTCRVMVLEIGSFKDKQIKVEVQIVPTVTGSLPKSIEAVDGESVSLECQATGKPLPTYAWIKKSTKGNLATSSDRFTVNERTGVLTINRVTTDDNDDFICVATNSAGNNERSVRVNVIVKPFVSDIKNITVPTGENADLECRATGNPLPQIAFRKLSSDRTLTLGSQSHDKRITVEFREDKETRQAVGTLHISELERRDDGLYACIATNKGGRMEKNGHIQVEFAPSFEFSPMKEAWSWSRRPINLTCIAESIPNATIAWKLNDRLLDRDPNFVQYGNGPQSSLLVTPSSTNFYGIYKCVGRNIHGEAEHKIHLQEARIPSEISQAKVETMTATTITFTFMGPGDSGGRPVVGYVVNYKKERDMWNVGMNQTWPIDSPYILEALEPQVAYNFRFAALNEVGLGNWGANQQHTMPRRSSPETPLVLNQELPEGFHMSPYADHFELRWKKPADNGEYIDFYQIDYCPVLRQNDEWIPEDSSCRSLEVKSTEVTSAEVVELIPDTYYKVELRAHNAIGFSLPGTVHVRTARGSDSRHYHNDKTHLSSSRLIAVVVGALVVILIIIDVSCFFINDTGLLWLICGKKKRKTPVEDAKLGSEGKELLTNGNRDGKIRIENKPMIEDGFKRNTTVEYDVKRSISRTSFVGKDSAV